MLLVTPPGGRLLASHPRHASDRHWLFDDAPAAAREAARPQLDGAPESDEANAWSLRTLLRIRAEVRRSGVVHLQDYSSLAAAICTLCAWLYYRPTIVGPSAEADIRPPAPPGWTRRLRGWRLRGWRRRLFVRCFGGSIVRFATRVVVLDPETFNKMLARGVEPMRIELSGPTVDLATVYEGLYEEIARPLQPRSSRPVRRPRLADDTVSTMRLRGWLSVAAVAIVLAAVALLTPIRGAFGHQLALSFARQPEPFTAVFIPEPLALPTSVRPGGRIAFSFAVSNEGDITVRYRYAVTESGSGETVRVRNGGMRVAAGQTVRVPLVIRAARFGPRMTILVAVTPSRLSVAFHILEVSG